MNLLEGVVSFTGIAVWTGLAVLGVFKIRSWLLSRSYEDLEGRWVVVTGCDSGLGRGVVEALLARRASVIACCLSDAGASEALASGAALAPALDLTDDSAVQSLARDVEEQTGGSLWGLVHCAGIALPGFIDYQPVGFYRETMAINFFAPVLLTQKLLPLIRKARGRVVIISSVDGLVSLPGNAPYDASKFAVEAYADALRAEVSFWGVSVSVINPATMRTPMVKGFFPAHRKAWQEMARLDPEGEWRTLWPEEWLEAYIKTNAKGLERIAQDPRHAINDIVHATSARRPRLRYLSGTAAKTLFYALWVGPESWSLAFKRKTIQPSPPIKSD